MLDNIYDVLKYRLGGAPVGVCGEDGEGIIAALAPYAGGLDLRPLDGGCGAAVFFGERPDILQLAAERPFVVVSAEDCSEKYDCACVAPADFNEEYAERLFRALAGEFPLRTIGADIPGWMRFLPKDNSAISELTEKIAAMAAGVSKLKHIPQLSAVTEDCRYWSAEVQISADLATGDAVLRCSAKDGIFFDMLSEIAGEQIDGEYTLMKYISSASEAKRGYAKVRDALECASVNGYGIVSPDDADMTFERPQTVRQGSSVGIKLRASAPAYHVIRVDVTGEVCPVMGDASQSEGLVKSMMEGFETNPEQAWNTDVFGKSLRSMVKEALGAKVCSVQDDTRAKLKKAVTRMVNEGKGGVICIIL